MKNIFPFAFSVICRTNIRLVFLALAVLFTFAVRTNGQTISGTFSTLQGPPVVVTGFVLDPAAGYIYAIGDDNNTALYRYNIATNTWSVISSSGQPAAPRNNAGATLLNGKIYFSYCDIADGDGDIYVYTISSNTWQTIIGPGVDKAHTGNISNDGTNIYLACEGEPGKFWRYNIGTGSWTYLAMVPMAESWGGLSFFNGYFYFQEGDGGENFFRYHILSNTWETLDPIPGNGVLGSAIDDAYFFCIGDYSGTDLYSYDLGLQSWNNIVTLPWDIQDAGLCIYQGSVYILQGESATGFTKFTPTNPLLRNMELSNLTYTIGSGNTSITASLTPAQTGGTNFQSATISITENYEDGKDILSFTNNFGITGSWSAATGILTLTGTTSIANYQSALRSVQYSNNDNSSVGNRIISFQVSDGTNSSNVASRVLAFPGPPEVYTSEITNVLATTATSGGTIKDDGGSPVTARGVCWKTGGIPTIADSKTTNGTGTGSFTSSIAVLTNGTYYHVRAYAVNATDTAYGEDKMMYTGSSQKVYAGADQTITTGANAQLSGIVYTTGTCEGFKWITSGDGTFLPNHYSTVRPIYVPGTDDEEAGFVSITLGAIFDGPVTVTDEMELTIGGEDPPVAGTLTKNPNTTGYCMGTNVSATLTAGSGGNGTDETQYRTNNGSVWSDWATYSSGANISTTGKTGVEIRTRRLADSQPESGYNTVSWAGETVPSSGTLTKSPNQATVCAGTNVSATLTAGSGGSAVDSTYSRTKASSVWSAWTAYTSGSNISTTGKTDVEIRTKRKGTICSDASWNTVSWVVEQTPVSGTLTKSPNQATVCAGTNVSATLTAGSGGSGVDSTYSRTKASSVWSAWTAYTSASNISTTGKTDVEIRTKRKGAQCSDASWTTVSWVVEQTAVSGTLAKSPDQATVCEGANVSATLTTGSGGAGVDSTYSRTKASSIWSAWTAYTSASDISTTGKTDVEIRTKRKGTICSDASWTTVSWVVEQTPVTGTLAKSPDQATICEGTNVSATLTAGSGGSGVDSTYSRTKASAVWSAWTAYTSATNISTTGKTDVEIRTKHKGAQCSDASWTTVSWVVEQTPVSGTLAKSPDQATVCEGANVAATLTAGSGGSGVDSTYSRTKASSVWSDWTAYTSATNISTTGKTDVEIRTKRTGTECSDASWTTVSWVVEQTPVTGTLAKSPDQATVCEGANVSATLTAGSGGAGVDSTYSRTKASSVWSAWTVYTSASNISTTGKTDVEIRTKRKGTECSDASWSTVSWVVEQTPVTGTLTKSPNQATVCQGANVSATLTAGSGGSGVDSTYSRTKASSVWSAWSAYTSASDISTTGKTDVEIRTKRKGTECSDASWSTVSWVVEQTPVTGTLAKSPDQATVCEGTDVAATLTAGSGGAGVDSTYSRTKASSVWSEWSAYTSASDISTTGKTDVEIRTKRKGTECSDASWTTVSWEVEQTPVTGTLAKSPDQATVCEGTDVAATLTAGSGGAGVDSTYSRTKASSVWSDWTAYTSASDISTTGKTDVEIRTKRKGTECSDASWTTVSWVVEQTPVTGTLAKSPDLPHVCEGTDVAATLTAGSGGAGVDSTYSRTKASSVWSAWSAYTSASDISTTGKTDVEIRTKRKGTECSDASWTTVSWEVEQTPVTGTLARDPNVSNVCEGTQLSAALTSGAGGNGTDELELRSHDGVSWTSWDTYTSGADFSSADKIQVQIRTRRSASYCSPSDYDTVFWLVDSTTVGGEVTGGTEVCYGSNSTLLTLEDQVGAVQKWQYSTDGLIWQDMTHTSTQYTATDLIVDTWYRAVVKSGECLTEISDSTLITIFADFHISGYAKYQNNPMTPLDGLKITLKKEGTQLGEPVITGPTGYYDFSGLVNGDYALEVSSAHPSGLWQTWGGVNNTDYLLVSRHIAGTQLLQIDPPVVRVTASTKLPHPAINNSDATAIRQAAKYPLTGYTFFDIPKWVFSGTTTLTPISAFTLNCASVTRDIRGLCAGDVNGTYIPPSGNKNLEANLELIHRGRLPVSDEMIFPVQAEMDMEIGAITLMLSFDAANLMITSVDMPGSHQEAPWFRVEGNTLYIGWMSLDAIRVARGETLLRIHGIKTGAAQVASATSHEEPVIRFTLQQNPLCELADATGEVLYYAKLAIADAGPVTAGYDEIVVSFYPNPAADVLNIETIMPVEGQFKADLITVTGSVAGHLQERILKAGLNKLTLDISNLPNGAYLLRVVAGDQTKTMKVIVNQ